MLPNQGAHGPHIPLGVVKGNGQTTHYVKLANSNKIYQHIPNSIRQVKPVIRVPVGAYSTRDEVYLPAPASASHNFFNKGYSTIKIRETPGLGIVGVSGNKHFQFPSQSHNPFEFSNQFVVPGANDNFFRQYTTLPNGFTGKPAEPHFPIQIQSDDYIRNLVPPPYKFYQEKNKLKNKFNLKTKETVTESNRITNNPQFGNKPASVQHAMYVPHNIDVQVSPPQDNSFGKKPSEDKDEKEKAVELQVTKEKLQTFHNTVPPPTFNSGFDNSNNFNNNYKTISSTNDIPPPLPSLPTYEVTEANLWQDSLFQTQFPTQISDLQIKNQQKRPLENRNPSASPFLPTPFKSEALIPTSPTQSEVSTIFTKLSLKQKVQATANPLFFDVKEVSTHYPIIGSPNLEYNPEQVESNKTPDIPNEITTYKDQTDNKNQLSSVDSQAAVPVIKELPNKTRLKHRQRRPGAHLSRPTTTEESVVTVATEAEKIKNEEITEKPVRRRRPIRYRTTTAASISEDVAPQINREHYRRRPNQKNRYRTTTESSVIEEIAQNTDSETQKPESVVVIDRTTYRPAAEDFSIKETNTNEEGIAHYERESTTTPNTVLSNDENIPSRFETQAEYTKEQYQSTSSSNVDVTEAVEYTTPVSRQPEPQIDEETTLATTTLTTSTTTEPPTKSHRIRGRPIKYDAHNRPRFSVKDYRQRLNQYTSTTTTDIPKISTDSSTRIKYLNRFRRPTSTSQTEAADRSESQKSKYKQNLTTEETSESIITDKQVKAVNTRLRPFGRYRSTTEPTSTTTTAKVTIRSNIFSNLRRPTPVSLRKRIFNKQKNITAEVTTTEAVPEEENETELTQIVETTIPYSNQIQKESSTELSAIDTEDDLPDFLSDKDSEEIATTSGDILKSDTFLQRVSDLTSSAKKEYDTPGLFKSVPPTSRRIPSYFTIATEDPILPIETFFANIKDKEKS